MRNFVKIAEGIDVAAIALALNQHPELWDEHRERKSYDGTPHTQMQDIWLRFNDRANLQGDYAKFTDQHESVWYPAIDKLPQVRPLIFWLMSKVQATRLGGVLITKVRPGGRIAPHVDRGWHPEYYKVKLYVPIQSNPHCLNRCEEEWVSMSTGDCWYFNNLVEHEVLNRGKDDRIMLIICLRCD